MLSVYEIHITVILKPHEIKVMRNYINNDTELFSFLGCIRPHFCHAQSLYGDYPDQPMFTTCIASHSDEKVIDTMNKISSRLQLALQLNDIHNPEIRNKVELKNSAAMRDLRDPECKKDQYYEFHWKITCESSPLGYMTEDSTAYLTDMYHVLADLCDSLYVYLSFNKDKPIVEQYPIATMRFYDCSIEEAKARVNYVLAELSSHGFSQSGTTQCEMAVYDSNVHLDGGWVFDKVPRNLIFKSLHQRNTRTDL
jgi:hypothetical protein